MTKNSAVGLRQPGREFRIMCLESSVISFLYPSSGGSPGPVWPIHAKRWPKSPLIFFCPVIIPDFPKINKYKSSGGLK